MEAELAALLGSPKLTLALIMTPSLVVGLVLIFLAYRLFKGLGGRFIGSIDRQAAAFEKIAGCVEQMKTTVDTNQRVTDDLRITLAAMGAAMDSIHNKVDNISARLSERR